MKENKTLIVAIVTVAILVVVFAGVTYAFFTASNNNLSASTVAVTGGAMKITYSDGTNDLGGKLISTDFQPSNDILVDKTFTLVGKNTATADGGLDMEYYIGIAYKSTFTDGQLHWYLKRMNTNSNITSTIVGDVTSIPGTSETEYNHGTFSPDDIYVKLVTGVFKPSTVEQSITFNLKMQFPDTGENQNENKGAIFNGKIVINGEPKIAVDYLVNLENTDAGKTYLRYDGMDDSTISSNGTGNLRYFGSGTNADDVPNYVSFNNELWRIIGVFETYDADKQENVKAVKIIRNESLGNYSWDSSGLSINSGYGVNAWNDADLMKELNGDYLNTSLTANTDWGYEWDPATFDRTKVITDEYQQFIMNARWYLGGYNSYNESASNMYTYERNGTGSKKQVPGVTCTSTTYCNDTVTRADYIDNLIGLAYPSDFGFAAKDNGSSNCSSNIVNDSNCSETYNWMTKYLEWTISQYVDSSDASNVLFWSSRGVLYYAHAYYSRDVRPVLYLSSDVLIDGGTGNSKDPYRLLYFDK